MTSPPLALIAEVTHRCPLHCVYCSNPLELKARAEELSTETWSRVFEEGADLGMLHVHFTGGEPLARNDLAELVSVAHSLGLYTNLITSGIGLKEKKLATLIEVGLDHMQLSFQDGEERFADWIAGAPVHGRKLTLAGLIRESRGLAFTVNLVVHRHNLDRLDSMISFAESLGPQRIEIANVQYYGWAWKNREWLLPTREQVDRSLSVVEQARERLQGQIKIDFVPSGSVLPCHAAAVIPDLHFENVEQKPLRWIWQESPAFRRFRGEDWIPEPCKTCERRRLDFGCCRCQAFLITVDANAADPVCSLAPAHRIVEEWVAGSNSAASPAAGSTPPPRSEQPWTYRPQPA